MLGVLQSAYPIWPGMGSEVVFELWRKNGNNGKDGNNGKNKNGSNKPGDVFVRVLFSGQALNTSTPLGVLSMVPLASLDAYLDSVIPKDMLSACQGHLA